MSILVTGGAGYIGSHTCVELLNLGYEIVIVDNLSNSKYESVERVKKITGKEIKFYKTDILDKDGLEKVFLNEKIDAVMHFAGLKAVGESVAIPLDYYHNNITGTLNLLFLMKQYNVKNFIFSSSATVYGEVKKLPLTEDSETGGTTNPYGTTKLMIEWILKDLYNSDNSYNIMVLRYFNPIGAHISGTIGEDPNGIPNNLMPYISQVAIGKLEKLSVFGNDYDTVDGTGVRDYIHVVDLAIGHIKALEHIENAGYKVYNLGTGYGISVLQMIEAFEKSSGKKVPYQIVGRRAGDIAICYADPSKAEREINFKALKNLDDMCKDTWRWQENNPNGF